MRKPRCPELRRRVKPQLRACWPAFARAQDDLNNFMHQKSLPPEMQRRLREYFHQTKHLQMANAQRHLFLMMSPSLQGEVAWVEYSVPRPSIRL